MTMSMSEQSLFGSVPQSSSKTPPPLHVCVRGLSFEYQFTDADVRKVFSRYGEVCSVEICSNFQAPPACYAKVTFSEFATSMAAWSDLHGKQLSGIAGAYLCVTCPGLTTVGTSGESLKEEGSSQLDQMLDKVGKKYTCRLEIGIENDKEFKVGSKVISIARKIWQELPAFKEHSGKTRLRGKGVGGVHESDEALALCISCKDASSFEGAVRFAEVEISRIHTDYLAFCQSTGREIPDLKPCKAVADHPHTSAPWQPREDEQSLNQQIAQAQGLQYLAGQQNLAALTGLSGGQGGLAGLGAALDVRSLLGHGGLTTNQLTNQQVQLLLLQQQQQQVLQQQVLNPANANLSLLGGPFGLTPQTILTPQVSPTYVHDPMSRGVKPAHAPPEHQIEQMIEDRNEARKSGNFAAADDIRDHLKRLGVVLMDEKGARGNRRGAQVTRWRYWNP